MLSGESCLREVAAFILDHRHFSGVPPTTFVEVVHQALTFVPFTGLEVTSDFYISTLSSLIKPVNLDDEQPISREATDKHANQKTPESTEDSSNMNSRINSLSQPPNDLITKRIA